MIISKPKISIITVVLNAAGALEKTITNVLGQDYPDLEYIVIDGGSKDGSLEVIKSYSEQIAWWISESDRGIYDAMNKGLSKATGNWVNFMNAGDTFTGKDILSKVMSQDLAEFGVVYGDSIAEYTNRQVLRRACDPSEMTLGMGFCHQAVFVRRDLTLDGFDLSFKIAADFKMLFRLFTEGIKFKKHDFPVAIFNASGLSNTKMAQSARERFTIVKEYKKLNLHEWLYHVGFICWVALLSFAYRILPAGLVRQIRG